MMRELYPPLDPASTWFLDTSTAQRVYVEECGNPRGIPVVFLHGGPGSGCKPYHRQFFHAERYRIIIFDQRGCGRSTPQGETRDNTTPLLLDDLEAIRRRLGIDQWVLFGGSWGAALALLYAEAYPRHVLAMILRGTFLARQCDIEWFFKTGVNSIFPDEWAALQAAFGTSGQTDLIAIAYQRMRTGDPALQLRTARAWSAWTGRVVTYLLAPAAPSTPTAEENARMVSEVLIETHYAQHRYFIDEDQILRNVAKLPSVPITIVHGRRDLTCTLEASWTLHQRIPDSKLIILREAGHLANEPAMIDALVNATEEIAEMLL